MYKSQGQFPVKFIKWDSNLTEWTLYGQVGQYSKLRFTNQMDDVCPPRSFWYYSTAASSQGEFTKSNLTIKPYEKRPVSCPPSVIVTNSENAHSSLD